MTVWIGVAQAESPIARDLPPGLQIPEAARPAANFDVDRATEAYLNLLLADETYALSVVELDGSLTACGRDLGRVVAAFEQSGLDHIDVWAAPTVGVPDGMWKRFLRPLRAFVS